MKLTDSLIIALRGLSANKMRTGLTMLGLIIGVAAVIALMSVGKGAEASIVAQIQGMGTNLLFVSPGTTQTGGVSSGAGTATSLTYEDAIALAAEAPTVSGVAPEAYGMTQVVAGPINERVRTTGTTPDFSQASKSPARCCRRWWCRSPFCWPSRYRPLSGSSSASTRLPEHPD